MRIKTNRSSGSVSYTIIDDTKSASGKRTTTVVENLGNENYIMEKYGVSDARAWAEEHLEELKRKASEGFETIEKHYNSGKIIEMNKAAIMDAGYLVPLKIFRELKLDDICSEIETRHNFRYKLSPILELLTASRIINPCSKKSTYEYSSSLAEGPEVRRENIYRALEVLYKENDFIQSQVYKNSLGVTERNNKVLYYDCTNFFFEIEEACEDKQYGLSKQHQPSQIITMGLFMDGNGLPLAFCMEPGNNNEQLTMGPLEKKVIRDFGLSRFVVCTDAGLSSTANRKFNDISQRSFVTTQSLKKMKKYLKDWFFDSKGWNTLGADGRFHKNIDLTTIDKENDSRIYFKERYINENDIEQRLIVTYSAKYMRYQRNIRDGQVKRAENKLKKPSSINKPKINSPDRFIEKTMCTKEGEIAGKAVYTLNEKAVSKEEMFDGYYGICTNLEDDIKTILRINTNRWEIEESFRIMKTEFESRPVFLSVKERIRAHFLTCFLALLIFRILEKKINEKSRKEYSVCEIIDTLRKLKLGILNTRAYTPMFERTELTDIMMDIIGFRLDTEAVLNKNLRKAIKNF